MCKLTPWKLTRECALKVLWSRFAEQLRDESSLTTEIKNPERKLSSAAGRNAENKEKEITSKYMNDKWMI